MEREKALDTAIAQLEKQFGKGTVMRLGDTGGAIEVEAVSTGSLALDAALGIGGMPKGRVVEVYGPEGSGKTTIALHLIASVQREGGTAAFIDAEHALDPVYAEALGVDAESLLISQPDNGEQALEITEALARSGAVDVIVVDSVAALVPKAEIEGEMGESFMGLQARLMSQALRKLVGHVAKANCLLVFINQLRDKIGIVYGNPEVTTGGKALKYYTSVRIEIRRVEHIKVNGTNVGSRTKAKVVKNKMAPPFKEAEFDIMYGEGISKLGELLDLGVKFGFIQKAGAWFGMGEYRLGQGRDAAKEYFRNHPDEAEELERKIRAKLMGKELEETAAPAAPAKKGAKTQEGKKAAAKDGVEVFADDFEDD
ncbi:MAG: recombinase RecA [Clostridia bacterium]|nr:recombinase RecA [Clostridia bacterium]